MHFFWWSFVGYYKTHLSYIPALWVPTTAYQVTSAFAFRKSQCHVRGTWLSQEEIFPKLSKCCHRHWNWSLNYHDYDFNVFLDPTLEIIDRISKENAMTDKKNAQKREPDFWGSLCLSDHVGFEICAFSSPLSLPLCYLPLLSQQNDRYHSVVFTSRKTHY